jgi:pilus assembly protein CpaB
VSSRRVLILLAAVVLAAIAGVAAYSYLTSAQDRANKNAALVQVFVVKKDIPKALPGDQAISGGYIKQDKIQAKFRPATALNNEDAIRGKVSLTQLAANTVLVDGQFVEPRVAQLTNSERIPKNRVAITVSLDQIHGVAGLLVPGDKVDLLIQYKQGSLGGGGGNIKLLYQNVDILFIGQAAAPQPGETTAATNPGSNLITFDVPADAAQKIALAQESGAMYATLVPPDNTAIAVPPTAIPDVINNADLTPYDHETK